MSLMTSLVRVTGIATVLSVLSACAPQSYLVKAPTPSTVRYEAAPAAKSDLALVDAREGSERTFSSGVLPAALQYENAPIDPPKFLATHLQAELAARGLPVQVQRDGTGLPKLHVKTFRILNHRASGFSPFVTFTFVAADVETPSGKKRVGAFVKRGKVPVMTFDEVIEPTFNQPLSLAVKELTAKLSHQLYGSRASDRAVDELVAKLAGKREPDSYLDVYALGFTNNPRAVDHVTRLASDTDENVRLAAISSLGTLRANAKLELLKSIYGNRTGFWHDRAMAIKSIGDLGTPEAKAFLAEQLKRWEGAPGNKESEWTAHVIRLYQ